MSVYVDSIGNYFLGDCVFGNHSLDFPSNNHLASIPPDLFLVNLGNFFLRSGLKYRNIISQTDFNTLVRQVNGSSGNANYLPRTWFAIGSKNDSIDDRWTFGTGFFYDNSFLSGTLLLPHLALFNNTGYTSTTNENSTTASRANLLSGVSSFVRGGTISENFYTGVNSIGSSGFTFDRDWITGSINFSTVYFCGVSDGCSLSLFMYQMNFLRNESNYYFVHMGEVFDVNTGYNYYSSNIVNKTVFLISFRRSTTLSQNSTGFHYIGGAGKFLLDTGDAEYPIVCIGEGGTPSPTDQWATDFLVFDENPILGFPAIGKVRNLLLAQGTYTIGKPVKIEGVIKPDNGSDTYLPVGTFAGKTVLMRCYSSPISTGVSPVL